MVTSSVAACDSTVVERDAQRLLVDESAPRDVRRGARPGARRATTRRPTRCSVSAVAGAATTMWCASATASIALLDDFDLGQFRDGPLRSPQATNLHAEAQRAPCDLGADGAHAEHREPAAVQTAERDTAGEAEPMLGGFVDPDVGDVLLEREHHGEHPLADGDGARAA